MDQNDVMFKPESAFETAANNLDMKWALNIAERETLSFIVFSKRGGTISMAIVEIVAVAFDGLVSDKWNVDHL
ncbi:hypothetical protein PanWU01x14_124710 [Parasponia andersonii]|uniref:Uncharacterized protein n=1 Tax=Parasponia andersonii TaxID=3476 RepID=A0A2P5CTM3_PARAD|nr:hypothetical protein PanWU01x14_124710 [Parasponia andersonii]